MSEVMFDKAAGISAELPDHMEWVHEKAKPLFESWGFKVIIEQSEKDYLDCFYHVCKKPKIHQERAGKYSGFPLGGTCLIQRECKTRTAKTVKKKYLSDDKTVEYIGIASDEVKRQGQLGDKRQSLLCRYGVREADTYDILKPFGLLSPIYSHAKRGGCWFCHNQGVDQLRLLRRNYPDLWALLMKWDLDSPVSFKADGHTVHDFDRRFQMEDERKVPMGRSFRWAMLDKPPKFVGWESVPISFL
jgi:hypothetical protein